MKEEPSPRGRPWKHTARGSPGGLASGPGALTIAFSCVLLGSVAGIQGGADSSIRPAAPVSPSGLPSPLPPSFTVRIVASPAQVDLGQTSNLTAFESGGIAPFNYSWAGLPQGCANVNHSSLNCTATASGQFVVSVTVKDAVSHTARNSTALSVVVPGSGSPFANPLFPYIVAAAVGALTALLVLFGLVGARRRRRRKAPPVPYTGSQYVPPAGQSVESQYVPPPPQNPL